MIAHQPLASQHPAFPRLVVPRTVVLVGLMGAGKTSIGRRLAARLDLPFRDADHEIETAAGRTIEEFRAGERRGIGRVLQENPPHIPATRGGAHIDDHTRELIRAHGISVWLRAEVDVLLARTSRRNNRPLLKQGNPREILGRLIALRYPVYAEADITVDSIEAPPEETVERVLKALEAWPGVTKTYG